MNMDIVIQPIYLISAILFILSLMWMNHPSTARRGVFAGVIAMLAAIGGTLLLPEIQSYTWIIIAMVVGCVLGVPLAMVPLTAVPQRTALSHAFGGLAAGLGRRVGVLSVGYRPSGSRSPAFDTGALVAEVILGFLTFTGSLMAAGKLMEIIPTRPITYKGQNAINLSLLGVAILAGVLLVIYPDVRGCLFPLIILLSLAFGVLLIIPIGGADMPTVIALLNAYAGLSAVAMGFVLEQQAADRRRRAGRLVGPDPLDHHVQGDEPLVRQRAVRGLRPGSGRLGRGRAAHGQKRHGRGRGPDHGSRPVRGHHPRLRHGGGPGPAPRARVVRRADARTASM